MQPVLADLGLVTVGDESAWAVTSPDDRYRYVLGRMWDRYFDREEATRPLWVWGMLNPSRARVDDDPTVTKVIGFTKRGGGGGLLIVNMLAYSTPYPQEMVRAWRQGENVVGEHNAAVLRWALSRPAMLGRHVAAWGIVPPKLRSAAQSSIVQFKCSRPDCLGINADGSPKHPGRIGYDTPIVPLAIAERYGYQKDWAAEPVKGTGSNASTTDASK
jgi:hypothetical protein